MMLTFSAFLEWAFLGVVTGGVYILWQMKESVNHLNSKIEVLIVQHEMARKDLDDHEIRLRELES
jgi:pyrimidine operon attenuation protein/uracil phosphoribosyltransferase